MPSRTAWITSQPVDGMAMLSTVTDPPAACALAETAGLMFDAAVDWATTHVRADGSRPIDDPAVRERLMRARIDIEVCRGFAYHCADLANEGAMFGVEGSMTKLFASETFKRHCREAHDMMGAEGLLTLESPEAHREGLIEEALRHSPVTAIYGGTSEIMKTIIAKEVLS